MESEDKKPLSRSIDGWRSFLRLCRNEPWFFGMCFYQAWLSLSFYTSSLFPTTDQVGTLVDSIWMFSAGGFVVGLILCLLPVWRHLKLWSSRSLLMLWISTIVMSLGTLASIVAGPLFTYGVNSFGNVCTVAGMTLGSMFSAVMVVLWGAAYRELTLRNIIGASFGTMVASTIIFLIISMLPSVLVAVCTVLLPLASGFSLHVCFSHSAKDATGSIGHQTVSSDTDEAFMFASATKRFSVRLLFPFFLLFIYALGGELLRGFSTVVEGFSTDVMGIGYTLSLGIGALLWLILIFAINRFDTTREVLNIIRISIVIMAAAFIVLAIFDLSTAVAYGIFGFGFQCVRAFAWIIAIDVSRRSGVSVVSSCVFVQLAAALAPCIAPLLQSGIMPVVDIELYSWDTITMLFAFIMLALALLVLNERDMQSVWGLAYISEGPADTVSNEAEDASIQQRLPFIEKPFQDFTYIAKKYGLSKRECEVAELLARGRSLPYIENELHISHGTSQTHRRHIYQKMHVDTRQEFLDCVEKDFASKNE